MNPSLSADDVPYSRGGNVRHSHVSVIKFIERNWDPSPLTNRSRDNLRNPVMSLSNPCVPAPAIGDLFDMFNRGMGTRR
jgi:phospholipase C